ncbi:MAG: hypothetical protein HYW24_02370 [Candidatus Aenigmarchaeota archaeon]|nr:hypothetical protein [Candidatus Aenigmarchaeota archaeon]
MYETKPYQFGEEKADEFRKRISAGRIQYYDDISVLGDGTILGHSGTGVYILGEDGHPVSARFYEIAPTRKGYMARIGGTKVYLDGYGTIRRVELSEGLKRLWSESRQMEEMHRFLHGKSLRSSAKYIWKKYQV